MRTARASARCVRNVMSGGSAIIIQYYFVAVFFTFIESNTDVVVNICKQFYLFGNEGV